RGGDPRRLLLTDPSLERGRVGSPSRDGARAPVPRRPRARQPGRRACGRRSAAHGRGMPDGREVARRRRRARRGRCAVTALERLTAAVVAPDERLGAAARQRLDTLTKPRGSLGRLEELAVRLVVITGDPMPRIEAPVIFTLTADHGVATEGVSAYPQAVTAQMVENFARGGAAVNVLARHVGARVVVANFGVTAELDHHEGILRHSIGAGTR